MIGQGAIHFLQSSGYFPNPFQFIQSYLYRKRFVGRITEIIHSLRNELYVQPYHQVDWNNTRNTIAKEDLYFPHPLVQDMLRGFLYHCVEPIMTQWPFSIIRKTALEKAMEHVHYEDENSSTRMVDFLYGSRRKHAVGWRISIQFKSSKKLLSNNGMWNALLQQFNL